MCMALQNDHSVEPVSPLPVLLATIGLIVVVGFACSKAKISQAAMEPIIGVAALIPPAGLQTYRRSRIAPQARALAVAQNARIISPVIVALIAGAVFILVDSLLGGMVGIIAGGTAGAVLDIGGTHADEIYLLQQGLSGSLYIVLPILVVLAVITGRWASHYLQAKKLLWLLAAGAIYWTLRMSVILAFRSAIANDIGITVSLGRFALFYAAAALILTVSSWGGIPWARRSQDGFIAARMLAQLQVDDRKAALDLLRDSVRPRVELTEK